MNGGNCLIVDRFLSLSCAKKVINCWKRFQYNEICKKKEGINMFTEDHIFLKIPGKNQKEVLRSLAKLAFQLGVVSSTDDLLQDYLDREQESTTGFGWGVSIPHTKSDDVLRASVLFGRTEQPIEWHSLDGDPVNTIISLLVPASESDEHLHLLAALSRKLSHPDFVQRLKTGSRKEIYQLISQTIGE